ncbi:YjzD family protein [Metabacillus arenae]|uniref:YjzD family protein n=1 Tax=Metabacillus arenae TaxID=2771434 RepID=A0A926NKH1_9BACI|nr:YjzD family protein [Metabacillus arenae]MBD1383454.1 YjzD family protein [Metabacillus arenae]
MRFFWTFFWAFLLIHMATYVVSSMVGTAYSFTTATILAVAGTVLILFIAAVIPNEPTSEGQH